MNDKLTKKQQRLAAAVARLAPKRDAEALFLLGKLYADCSPAERRAVDDSIAALALLP